MTPLGKKEAGSIVPILQPQSMAACVDPFPENYEGMKVAGGRVFGLQIFVSQ